MTATIRAVLLAALASAIIPTVAAGQDTSIASLLRRIEILERANTDLERRISELESLIKNGTTPSQPSPASTRWRDLTNWRRLRIGMSMDEVRKLLGEPELVEGGPLTMWLWPGASVLFMDGKVERWSEPRR